MTAIDLYGGIGGWALGLHMAGVDVAASFEWWRPAAETYKLNLGISPVICDIRNLGMELLPGDVDVVVGSPPCTQFSFANRGGAGDIADGLKDIARFLEIVEKLSPTFWAMENVPRVASILEKEISLHGQLERYRHLVDTIEIVDFSGFGLPQRRRRMLAGNFSASQLARYASTARTLGEVIDGLSADPATDPIYGLSVPKTSLTGNDREAPLSWEERRLNKEAKQFHPVYNTMRFPDSLDESARTVTALCTRVSRESIIVRDGRNFRRLSLRERATLQGFPITYQFASNSYSECIKMIGNALPPLAAFHVVHAFLETDPADVPKPDATPCIRDTATAHRPRPPTGPHVRNHTSKRPFRSAIPSLRFGSGTRFEFKNEFSAEETRWAVDFYWGTSKQVCQLRPDAEVLRRALAHLNTKDRRVRTELESARRQLGGATASDLQRRWTGRSKGMDTHPFRVVDVLGRAARTIAKIASEHPEAENQDFVFRELGLRPDTPRSNKLGRLSGQIIAGFIVGSWVNEYWASTD